jgi:hypothetical protein
VALSLQNTACWPKELAFNDLLVSFLVLPLLLLLFLPAAELKLMSLSNVKLKPSLESLIQQNYPGPALPPLWEVIYQEAVRGHHLLFKKVDAERFDAEMHDIEFWNEEDDASDLEITALKVISCPDLQTMVKTIDLLSTGRRRQLYSFYKRALQMWGCYVKSHLN